LQKRLVYGSFLITKFSHFHFIFVLVMIYLDLKNMLTKTLLQPLKMHDL
jgi:hypothetical protein